ncbi:MAG TPA: tRNA pseudouridine(38-40) synthase TruA [Erysipelothrix sp.]|jgi:tRNA pseudouridine38-40 synthase|nr:tRNA pseudouridine(38-40) synthase TruA [Erysipelothrix sp.]
MLKFNRYKAICCYDGSSFIGWQRQKEGESVQSAIERVLTRMHKKETKCVGSGRTDRGVNALGQVFHFDSDLNIETDVFLKALNAQIHKGIHIKSLEIVDDNFHSLLDATYKVYRYHICVGENNPFHRHHIFYCDYNFDINKLKQAASYFVGEHDFSSYNTNSFDEIPNQVRSIYKLDVETKDNNIYLTFVGSGFMRYMVRMIVGTLIEISTKDLDPQLAKDYLEAKDKSLVSYMAKPQGLTLVEVGYKPFDNQNE